MPGVTDLQAEDAVGDAGWAQGNTSLGPLDMKLLPGLRLHHLTRSPGCPASPAATWAPVTHLALWLLAGLGDRGGE